MEEEKIKYKLFWSPAELAINLVNISKSPNALKNVKNQLTSWAIDVVDENCESKSKEIASLKKENEELKDDLILQTEVKNIYREFKNKYLKENTKLKEELSLYLDNLKDVETGSGEKQPRQEEIEQLLNK